MICFAGLGSLAFSRFPLATNRWLLKVPLAIAAAVVALTFLLQPLIDATIRFELFARCAVVVAAIAPIATLAGFCFPLGMTLVERLSKDATAWMWGVNGAVGVLASIAAVGVSMWLGIHVNLWVAAGLYALLTVPAHALARRAR